MEDNNNNIIVKGLAIILIAILGLNVYRTETTKKEMAQLATTVGQISAQLDSIGAVGAPAGTAPSTSGVSKREFTTLSKSVSSLESKVTALQGTVDKLSRSQAQSGTSARSSSMLSSSQPSSTGVSATSVGASSSNGRVSVSAKVKVEDRYVSGTTYLPKITTGPTGVVVVGITISHSGSVTSARVKTESTISDEDILDACKDAALRTRFNLNVDVSDKHPATITYTFTAK